VFSPTQRLRQTLFAPLGLFVPLLRDAPSPATAGPAHTSRDETGCTRQTLSVSVAEGMVAEAFTSCTSSAMLTAWAIALDCKPMLFGLLWALPYLAQGVQFPAAWLTSRFGARRVAITAVALSRQLQLPLIVLPFVLCSRSAQQGLFVAITGVAALLGVIGNNGWTTWMGDVVPAPLRGRYFGRRTALCTLAGTLGALGAGLLIDRARRHGLEHEGLALMALVACVLGAITTALMRRQSAPRDATPDPLPRWSTLLEPLRVGAVRRALGFNLVWNGAVGISASFFQVHMAQNLGLTFLFISGHCAATAAVRMLTSPAWGVAIDRVGARPVILACATGIALLPALWIFASPTVLWPLAVDFIVGGALWGGFNQAIFQLPLRVTPRRHRAFHLAAFSTAGGLAFALFSTAGGLIAQGLPPVLHVHGHVWVNFEVLFLVSTLLRLGSLALAARLSEPGAGATGDLFQLAARSRPMRPLARAARAFRVRRDQGMAAPESTPSRMEK
jgi:MFS family permease